MLLETERTSEAIDALAAALALDPGHLNARFNLGYALRRMGESEAAAPEFRRLTERYPNDAGHWSRPPGGSAPRRYNRREPRPGPGKRTLA